MHAHPSRSLILSLLALGATSPIASAQVSFSIDHSGPTITLPGPMPITAGDILTPALGAPAYGPLAPPTILLPGGPGGLGIATHPGCVGAPPTIGPGCPIEVDALSYGADLLLRPITYPAGTFVFSVDEFATGAPGALLPPNVTSEMPGVFEGSADLYGDRGLPVGPLGPVAPPGTGNSAFQDGDGLVGPSGFNYPGVGLKEPDFPAVIDGDDIDALDIDNQPLGRVFFSLDAAFFDPALGVPNSGTGPANGFPGAAVLTTLIGGVPAVYAAPALLGLDRFGPGTDDLDALILCENGVPGYQPSPGPYAWGPGGPDMLLFSVRRGSAVVGMADSLFGAPIAPGDILIPPVFAGGAPAIFIAAEWLGLATTRSLGVPFGGDDIDALDARSMPQAAIPYCEGTAAVCPCGNGGAPGSGCANSLFASGGGLSATGNTQVSADTVVLTGTSMPNSTCLYFQGTARTFGLFGDGLRCVGGAVIRLGFKINAANTSSYPVAGDPPISVAGAIPAAGGTRHYQSWYRNGAAFFCSPATFNLTNALSITWTP